MDISNILDFVLKVLHDPVLLLLISAGITAGLVLIFFTPRLAEKVLPKIYETRLAEFLPFKGLHTDRKTILCEGDTYTRVFRVDGLNTSFQEDKTRENLLSGRKQWIDSLGEFGIEARVFTVRKKVQTNEQTPHDHPLLSEIANRWNAKMKTIYHNAHYIMISLKNGDKEEALKTIAQAGDLLEANLAPYGVSVLEENPNDFSEEGPFSFLAELTAPITRPQAQAGLSEGIESIQDVLTPDDIIFHNNGLLEFKSGTTTKFATALGIRRAPDYIDEQMYSDLMTLDHEMTVLKTISPISRVRALAILTNQKRMAAMTSFSFPVVDQFDKAMEKMEQSDENFQSLVNFGETYFIFGDSEEELDEAVAEVNKICRLYGVSPVREGWVAQASWFSQFPTYDKYPRLYKLLSKAVSCAINFEKLPSGFSGNDWGDGSITRFPTSQGTMYQFQFHVNSNAAATGHTVVIGPTGQGKTTLYAFLAGQAMRYPDLKVFFFDRNRGVEIFTHAVGGSYLTFSGNKKEEDLGYGKQTFLNPLHIDDSPENRAFLRQWLKAITFSGVEEKSKEEAEAEAEIARAVTTNFDFLTSDQRMLSNLYKSCFAPNGHMRRELKRWIDPDQYGPIFNSKADNLDLSSQFTTFDFTNIFNDKTLAPAVISYIMNRIQTLTGKSGKPSLIVIDETAPMLEHPLFRQNFITGLQEGRKKRQAYLAAFQQPNIIDKLGVGEAIRGQCQTVIFFRNPQATAADYAGWNLTPKELAFIQGKLYPNLRYAILVSRPVNNESVILDVGLGGLGPYLQLFNSGRKQVLLAEELRGKYGDKFVTEYLKKVI
ncbi:MAG: hypothetical protein JXQ74_02690 [Alphaproteobacteria bacterium]|nr:hypothetical protein [Alphaproteobacteria bacterium]